jgi:TonB-dependent SusC/RagA subfamily outer membrane receptor
MTTLQQRSKCPTRSKPPLHLLAPAIVIGAAVLASADACFHAASEVGAPAPIEVARQRPLWTDSRAIRRFPGVEVVPTGRSAFLIRIHSGMVGDGDPLYVIDGTPMTIPASRGIDWFKPEDIAQIKLLKYPDELSVYGPRGVNGVIVITTKQALGPSWER